MQIPQFIPHGAISDVLFIDSSVDSEFQHDLRLWAGLRSYVFAVFPDFLFSSFVTCHLPLSNRLTLSM